MSRACTGAITAVIIVRSPWLKPVLWKQGFQEHGNKKANIHTHERERERGGVGGLPSPQAPSKAKREREREKKKPVKYGLGEERERVLYE